MRKRRLHTVHVVAVDQRGEIFHCASKAAALEAMDLIDRVRPDDAIALNIPVPQTDVTGVRSEPQPFTAFGKGRLRPPLLGYIDRDTSNEDRRAPLVENRKFAHETLVRPIVMGQNLNRLQTSRVLEGALVVLGELYRRVPGEHFEVGPTPEVLEAPPEDSLRLRICVYVPAVQGLDPCGSGQLLHEPRETFLAFAESAFDAALPGYIALGSPGSHKHPVLDDADQGILEVPVIAVQVPLMGFGITKPVAG
jgi:hypothetical protein